VFLVSLQQPKLLILFPFFEQWPLFPGGFVFPEGFLFFRPVRTPRLSSSGKSWSFLFPLHVLQPANTSGFRLLCRCSKFSLTRVSAGFNPRDWISCLQATRGLAPIQSALLISRSQDSFSVARSNTSRSVSLACSVLLCWPFFSCCHQLRTLQICIAQSSSL
jgi:hypothetical protein